MHAAVVIIDGRSRILFAGDSYDGKTTPHNEAVEANRGHLSRHRAGLDCRPGNRGSGGAVHHARAHAVRLEGRAARGSDTGASQARNTIRTVRCKARRRASPCRKPRSPRRRTPRRARPTTRRSRRACCEEPQIVEVPPARTAYERRARWRRSPRRITARRPPRRSRQRAPATGTTSTASASASRARPRRRANANPPAPGDANSGYFLQVGAYKTSADAEQQRARLAFQGFESKVTQRDAGGVTYYRVRIGPFSKFEDMKSGRQRLSDAGVDTAVIRFTKQ